MCKGQLGQGQGQQGQGEGQQGQGQQGQGQGQLVQVLGTLQSVSPYLASIEDGTGYVEVSLGRDLELLPGFTSGMLQDFARDPAQAAEAQRSSQAAAQRTSEPVASPVAHRQAGAAWSSVSLVDLVEARDA
ncbi:hypothetical protein HaLaN_14086, partial [Haematococcus lacustris]